MADIVDLVAEKTVARAVEVRKKNARASSGYRSVRLARKEAGEVTLAAGTQAGPLRSPISRRMVAEGYNLYEKKDNAEVVALERAGRRTVGARRRRW